MSQEPMTLESAIDICSGKVPAPADARAVASLLLERAKPWILAAEKYAHHHIFPDGTGWHEEMWADLERTFRAAQERAT